MHRAVFLDRDGTIIEERHYLSRPEDVVLLPGAGEALARLQGAGYQLFLVTNQSGIGRGLFTWADAERVQARVAEVVGRFGVRFAKVYVAPEAPDQPGPGRKPSPHFLFAARDEFGLDLGRSFMVGDKRSDVECGLNAGVQASLLVRTGYGREEERQHAEALRRAVIVDNLAEAADWILRQG